LLTLKNEFIVQVFLSQKYVWKLFLLMGSVMITQFLVFEFISFVINSGTSIYFC
jgi:hypothetical protein